MDTAAWFSAFASYLYDGSDIIAEFFYSELEYRFYYYNGDDDEYELDGCHDGTFSCERSDTSSMRTGRQASSLAAARTDVIIIETENRLAGKRKATTVGGMRDYVYIFSATMTNGDAVNNDASVVNLSMSASGNVNGIAWDLITDRYMLLPQPQGLGGNGLTDRRRRTHSRVCYYCSIASCEAHVLSTLPRVIQLPSIITSHIYIETRCIYKACRRPPRSCLFRPEALFEEIAQTARWSELHISRTRFCTKLPKSATSKTTVRISCEKGA